MVKENRVQQNVLFLHKTLQDTEQNMDGLRQEGSKKTVNCTFVALTFRFPYDTI